VFLIGKLVVIEELEG